MNLSPIVAAIHKQSDRKMPNHGIEFDGRECTSKRDAEGRLAIIRFEANTSQLICVDESERSEIV